MRVDDYIDAVIRSTKLSLAHQAVLWRIGRHVNWRTAETWVSFETLADECHVCRDQIRLHVAALFAAGVFTVERRPGRSSLIRLPIHPTLSTPRGKSREVERGDSRGVPRGESHATPREIPRDPAGFPGAISYRTRLEPAPRCNTCGERHNAGARCPAADHRAVAELPGAAARPRVKRDRA